MRKKPWAAKELAGSAIYLPHPETYAGHIAELFPNKNNALALELGCGKGIFLAEYGRSHPEINFIGIDRKTDILAVAHRNILGGYQSAGIFPGNILLLPHDICRIDALLFAPECFDEIHIYFPNPWPKAQHKKRRLTHPRQLAQYRGLLSAGGRLYFKTDDRELFEDTLLYLPDTGYRIFSSNRNFHAGSERGRRPVTEHERLFLSQNMPIYYIEAGKG